MSDLDDVELAALRLTAERYDVPLDTPWLPKTLLYATAVLNGRLRALGRTIIEPFVRLYDKHAGS